MALSFHIFFKNVWLFYNFFPLVQFLALGRTSGNSITLAGQDGALWAQNPVPDQTKYFFL